MVLVNFWEARFTRTVGGKVTGCYSEGSSEGGELEVH